MRIHIVQKGDTLWKIAKEYGVSFEDLKRLNAHLANPDYIVPGMEIILPEKINKEPHREPHRETDWGMHREGGHREGHKEHMHKESPIKHVKEKEIQRPMPPPVVVPPPPMPEPQMIPIPYPMPMPMPQQAPVELSWNQQVVMPHVEQNQTVSPIQIQPPPQPIAQPELPPPPAPMPQPIFIMPQMPAVPHCASCHQPVHHHMWWPMPMQMPMESQVEAYTMPEQPTTCEMPSGQVAGMENFLESSTSPFFPMKPEFEPMPEMEMEQSCGCQSQPVMMPNWQMDPCHCPPPCPPPCPMPCPSHCPMPYSSVGPWMTPHFFPGGMTPYRW
ncbi:MULTISPECIES: LysM domain-containing protein [Lysinibacillus]|uniref:LysM peptidoglycan-binding domain-containing protein n=1 Tax=Lysinibacillus TaxID=400634 RepID=UPI0006B06D5E|nr:MULTISPECIES: LysM domain-containing protein [Lysinibacillus]KOS60935.1 morphogenetic protein associated with SpoVID [Lysinibacillus sp. FJAT-14222]